MTPPDDGFRAAPLWSWNDWMDPAGCAAHVDVLAAAGFGGAYAHTRLGMLIPFLGDQYMNCLRACVERARRIGFKLNLYDEDRWPSGWAGGAVPRRDAAFRLKALVRRQSGEGPPSPACQLIAGGEFNYYVWTMPLGHPKFSGACYVDLTNAAAVECFLQSAYDPLADALEEHFGEAIEAIFTDEPALTYLYSWPPHGIPWSDAVLDRIRRRIGTPPETILEALFEDSPAAPRLRLIYYRELAALFDEAFMQQASAWRRRRGAAWTGHFMYEHSLPLHYSWGVNCHSSYRRFDWPGVDHLGRQVGEVVTAIGCRSAVHQFSKPRMMSELFGASGQNLSFEDRKWIAQQQIVLGANHLVPHVASMSIAGSRKRDYPPTLSPHQPWWPLNRHLEDHCARLSKMMAQGRGVPDLLVVHPQETVMALSRGPVELASQPTWETRFFCRSADQRVNELDDRWKRLCHELLDNGYVIDFGDEAILAEFGEVTATNGDCRFRVGDAQYRAVLIPSLATLRASTVERLAEFVRRGGVVACVGNGPTMIDGGDDAAATVQLRELLPKLQIRGADEQETVNSLLRACPPDIHIKPVDANRGKVWRYTREQVGERMTLVVNLERRGARTVELNWTHEAPKGAWVWMTHESHACPLEVRDQSARIELPPGSSCLVAEGNAARLPVAVKLSGTNELQRLLPAATLNWRVTRLDPNALVLDHAAWRRPGEAWQGPHPALAIKDFLDRRQYDGPLELRYSFSVAAGAPLPSALQAVFECDDEDAAIVAVNGSPIPSRPTKAPPLGGRGFRIVGLDAPEGDGETLIEIRHERFRYGDPSRDVDLRGRLGTPLESVVLLGDFSVAGREVAGPQDWSDQVEYHTGEPLNHWLPPQQLQYFAGPMTLEPACAMTWGDATAQGLPFYAGRLQYEVELDIPAAPTAPLLLTLVRLPGAVAAVTVNGRQAGVFAWAPYEVDLAPCLTVGLNQITVTLYHTLRNLLGPHHHFAGEPVYATPESFRPVGVAKWLEALVEGAAPAGWRDEYCIVEFGLGAAAPMAPMAPKST